MKSVNLAIHEYVPIVFDLENFCVMDVMIHSVLIGKLIILMYNWSRFQV